MRVWGTRNRRCTLTVYTHQKKKVLKTMKPFTDGLRAVPSDPSVMHPCLFLHLLSYFSSHSPQTVVHMWLKTHKAIVKNIFPLMFDKVNHSLQIF